MIPAWKIGREFRRLGQQLGYLPWIIAAPYAKKTYDRTKSDRIRLTKGQQPQSDELAILLLFQPDGLLPSTIHTLSHFQSKGISTFVVSNAPLSDADRATLTKYAWQVMERPNYGYDFGGYRDAILRILDTGSHPQRLFVVNDSIWFPLGPDSDLVDEARRATSDLFGFVLNDRMHGERRTHVQSYFFSFNARAVASDAFAEFWRNLFLTNNKNLVVRRCEIPMTKLFRKNGFSVSARHHYSDGAQALKGLDNATLRNVIAYQAKVDTRNAHLLKKHLCSDDLDADWRKRVDRDIDAGRLDKYFLIAHPAVLVGEFASPILKKDRQSIYQLQRSELMSGKLDAGFAPVIRTEISNWD